MLIWYYDLIQVPLGSVVSLIMATNQDLGSLNAYKAMGKVEEWNVP